MLCIANCDLWLQKDLSKVFLGQVADLSFCITHRVQMLEGVSIRWNPPISYFGEFVRCTIGCIPVGLVLIPNLEYNTDV